MQVQFGRILRLLLIAVLVTGCWDRREINDIAVVVASTIDKEGGEYRTTVQFPLPSQLGGTGSGGGGGGTSGGAEKKNWYLDSEQGRTIREVNGKQQRALSRQQIFSHRRALIVGEEAARAGLEPIVDILGRIPMNRMTAHLFVTHGQARHVLNVDAPIEQTSAEMAREMAMAAMKRPITLKTALHAMLTEGQDVYLPTLLTKQTPPGPSGKAQTSLRFDGIGVFHENRLVGYLKRREAEGALWALDQMRRPTVTVEVPGGGGRVSIEFNETTAAIRPFIKGNQIQLRIRIKAIGSLVENPTSINWAMEDGLETLERLVAQKISQDVQTAIRQLKGLHADILGIGDAVHRYYPAFWRQIADDWERHYQDVQVIVEVRPIVENTGSLTAPFGYKRAKVIK